MVMINDDKTWLGSSQTIANISQPTKIAAETKHWSDDISLANWWFSASSEWIHLSVWFVFFCFVLSWCIQNGRKIEKCRSRAGCIAAQSMHETSVEPVRYIVFGVCGDAAGCFALVRLVDVHGPSCRILPSAWNMFVRNAMALAAHIDPGQCLRRHEIIDREEIDAAQTHWQIHFRQTVSVCVQFWLHHELARHFHFASPIFR